MVSVLNSCLNSAAGEFNYYMTNCHPKRSRFQAE